MTIDGNIDYALARVQARYGRRLSEGDWRRLEASRDLDQYLDATRNSALDGWVSSLERTDDAHAIERSLRIEWRRHVDGVAAWHPREWQQWLAWLAWLPTLALLTQLARPEPAPAWMMADPVCGPIAPGTAAERIAALQGTALAAFEPGISGRIAIGVLWRARWDSLRPHADPHTQRLLDTSLRAIDGYAEQQAGDDAGSAIPQQALADRLSKLFRAGGGTVAASLCYLVLLRFDLQRLRCGLANRRMFGARAAEVA